MYRCCDLLRTNTLPADTEEESRVRIAAILSLAAMFYLFFGAYMSLTHGFEEQAFIQIGIWVVVFVMYLFLPTLHYVIFSRIFTALFTAYVFTMLYIDDYNMLFVLFLLPLLSLPPFVLVGKKEGIVWSVFIGLLFLTVLGLDYYGVVRTHFKSYLLFTFTVGFGVLSLLWYWIVHEREMYAQHYRDSIEKSKLLFKEMHHRTKNNMQVIISLLESHLLRAQNPSYRRLFQTYIDRIKTMSFVHENLYRTGDDSTSRINMQKYLGEVLNNLQQLTQHTIISDIDPIKMSIKHSMNLGLIVNEAVSNAMEHAYDAGKERIDVTLKNVGRDCILEIRDYGKGFNHHKEFNSLGLRLIRDLSGTLPNGRMSFLSDNGMRIQVIFDCPYY